MRNYTQKILTASLMILALGACNTKSKNLSAPGLFEDGLDIPALSLFNLLDDYPALKNGFTKLDDIQFNIKMNDSMSSRKENAAGGLRSTNAILRNPEARLRETLAGTADIIERMYSNNTAAYDASISWFENLRTYPKSIIGGLSPLGNAAFNDLYNTKSKNQTEDTYNNLAKTLEDQDTLDLMKDIEDLGQKALVKNASARAGLEKMIRGFLKPEYSGDGKVRSALVGMLGSIGDAFFQKAGFNDFKSPARVMKDLAINLEKFYTVGGSIYDASADYKETNFSAELGAMLISSTDEILKLINAPAGTTKEPDVVIIHSLAQNLGLFDFSSSFSGLGHSLKELMRMDFKGRDRAYNGSSYEVSALETLLFMMAMADTYGFEHNPDIHIDNTDALQDSDFTVAKGFTGSAGVQTGGIMTMGDSITALRSQQSGATGVKNLFSSSADKSFSNGVKANLGINTPTLSILQQADPSTVPIYNSTQKDKINIRTLPFMLKMIKLVLYSGYGPYYNKNRVEGNGDIRNIDGSIYKYAGSSQPENYKPVWDTADIRVKAQVDGGWKWVGPGGREINSASETANDYTAPASCGTGLDAGETCATGWSYRIWEVTKTASERECDNDEETIYKNFQWLLYEKRFVALTGLSAKITPTAALNIPAFIMVVANGLSGLMSAKPYCTNDQCSPSKNGFWLKDNKSIKGITETNKTTMNGIKGQALKQINFSNTPGDSVLMLEAWDYGTDGKSALTWTSLGDDAVYSLFMPHFNSDPTAFYGFIPPVLSQNFPVMELTGFLTDSPVPPASVDANWDKRNRLLPIIAALAKSMDDQVVSDLDDHSNNRDPYQLLSGLIKILARPYYREQVDHQSPINGSNPTQPTITVLKIEESDGNMRNPGALPDEYWVLRKDSGGRDLRSLTSVLIENERRYQDGLLNLVAKTDLLDQALRFFSLSAEGNRSGGADLIMSGLKQFTAEIKTSGATSVQFDIGTTITELRDDIAAYPDSRSSDLSHKDWEDFDDFSDLIKDFLSNTSVYSILPSVDFALEMLSARPPSDPQVSSMLDVGASMLVNKQGTQDYQITTLVTRNTPSMLRTIAPYGRDMNGVLAGLTMSNGFLYYIHDFWRSDYNLTDIFKDTVRLLRSHMIQTRAEEPSSLLYSSGEMMGVFAEILETGKKPSRPGYWFEDSFNETEEFSNYFFTLNFLFSKK